MQYDEMSDVEKLVLKIWPLPYAKNKEFDLNTFVKWFTLHLIPIYKKTLVQKNGETEDGDTEDEKTHKLLLNIERYWINLAPHLCKPDS